MQAGAVDNGVLWAPLIVRVPKIALLWKWRTEIVIAGPPLVTFEIDQAIWRRALGAVQGGQASRGQGRSGAGRIGIGSCGKCCLLGFWGLFRGANGREILARPVKGQADRVGAYRAAGQAAGQTNITVE